MEIYDEFLDVGEDLERDRGDRTSMCEPFVFESVLTGDSSERVRV